MTQPMDMPENRQRRRPGLGLAIILIAAAALALIFFLVGQNNKTTLSQLCNVTGFLHCSLPPRA